MQGKKPIIAQNHQLDSCGTISAVAIDTIIFN